MKPIPESDQSAPLLAFGAHPDDLEFGAGGILARETREGRPVHCIVCSRGEAGSQGTPKQRTAEARKGAQLLGATIEFITLDGDAQLELKSVHAIKLAGLIRRYKPGIVLAPTIVQNQHPDHWRLGVLVRDAARLARYGGLKPLLRQPSHAIGQLFFYALSHGAEPKDLSPLLVDVSDPDILRVWTQSMEAHASQMKTRNYVELQLARARVYGLNAGLDYAQPLWPNDPPVFHSLGLLARAALRF